MRKNVVLVLLLVAAVSMCVSSANIGVANLVIEKDGSMYEGNIILQRGAGFIAHVLLEENGGAAYSGDEKNCACALEITNGKTVWSSSLCKDGLTINPNSQKSLSISWDGLDDSGKMLEPGSYILEARCGSSKKQVPFRVNNETVNQTGCKDCIVT